MTRLVMLDRDGTINVEKHYLSSPAQVKLLPGAAEGIRLMQQLGMATAILTNQSGIARGYFDIQTLGRIHRRLRELLVTEGATVDAIYFCPHLPDEKCYCRKPAPGMAWRAADEFQVNLSHSFLVGDKPCDVELGKRVGATTILVRTGYGAEVAKEGVAQPDYQVENLLEAAHVIQKLLSHEVEGRG